jgi:hypothetical protein
MKITIDKHYSRKKLQMWLDYEIGGAALIFLHYFAFPVFFILPRLIGFHWHSVLPRISQ